MIIYFKISVRTWTIHWEAYWSVACKTRTVFSPFRQHSLWLQQQEQERDRSPSTAAVAVLGTARLKPTRLAAHGRARRAEPCLWRCCPFLSQLAFGHPVQVHVSSRVKNTRNFVPLNSPSSLLIKEWIILWRQVLWELFIPKHVLLCSTESKSKTQTQGKCAPYPKPQKAKLQRQQLKMLTILHLGRFVFNSDQQNVLFWFV